MILEKETSIKNRESSEILLNELNLIVITTNSKGKIVYVSKATEKILGYRSDELLNKGWWEKSYSSKDESARVNKKVSQTISGKIKINNIPYERKILSKNGQVKWIEWRDTLGSNNNYISVGVDITEWKEKEKVKFQSDEILKNIESIVLVSNNKGEIIYAAPSIKNILGYNEAEVFGDNWWKLTYKNQRDAEQVKDAILRYIYTGEKLFVNTVKQKIKTKDGAFKWIEWQRSRSINNTYISIGTDVTEHHFEEIELKKAKEAAEESLKIKNAFLANISHEIRTPLNAIIGFPDLLLETDLTNEQREYLHVMRNSGEILLSIINDVLDISKLESNKLEIENISFNLPQQVEKVINLMKIKTEDKKLLLKLDIHENIPTNVISDPTKIGQILLNIIGNSVKFTNKGSIDVTISLVDETATIANICIEVKDTGIGIVSNKINTIFESFSQAKSDTSRIYGGTGLGLTIVKKIVSLLKGKLEVSSIFGKGSVFKIILPLKKENKNTQIENPVEQEDVYDPLNLDILLVEDNKTNQLLAKTRLERWNCKVDIANNGIGGVKKTQRKLYDIILMDLQMPIMDGYEATKIIKNDISDKVSKIPILAMTAYTSSAEIKRMLNAGMDAYMFKPFKPNEFYNLLYKYGISEKTASLKEGITIENQQKEDSNKPLIDLSFIREETLNENSILKLMIELFIDEIDEFVEGSTYGLKNKNWRKLFEVTHKIQPNITMFGITKLEPVAHTLTNNLRDEKELHTVQQLFDQCNDVFKKVKIELRTELKSL